MADISFNIDPEVIIGTEIINRAGTVCKNYGNKVLIAAEQSLHESKMTARLIDILNDSGVDSILFDAIPPLAMADTAEAAAALARAAHCSGIIGFGGIIAQSIARMTAVIAHAGTDIFDLLEGTIPQNDFLPYIAIPSVREDPFLLSDGYIGIDPRDRAIKYFRAPRGLCKAVIIDANFADSQNIAAATFDGFCIAVESFCSKKTNFFSEPLLEEAITFYARAIGAFANNNSADMEEIAKAGFLASLGAATSSAGVGSALAYCIGGRFPVPKARISAMLLPAILDKLVSTRPEKMARVAALIGADMGSLSVTDAAKLPSAFIRASLAKVNIPVHLQSLGLDMDRLVPIAETARSLDFIGFSPWIVTSQEILDIVKQSF